MKQPFQTNTVNTKLTKDTLQGKEEQDRKKRTSRQCYHPGHKDITDDGQVQCRHTTRKPNTQDSTYQRMCS